MTDNNEIQKDDLQFKHGGPTKETDFKRVNDPRIGNEMAIEKARELVLIWESGGFQNPQIYDADDYCKAKGFISGYNAALKKAAEAEKIITYFGDKLLDNRYEDGSREYSKGYLERHRQGLELERAFDEILGKVYGGGIVSLNEWREFKEIQSRYRQQVYGEKHEESK